jgi:hypothetical protein
MAEPEKQTARPILVFRLRTLVLALGELSQPPWWRTQYLHPTGIRFLERIYPRTAFSAAVQATSTVARRVHDRSIGTGGVFHPFRLPSKIENSLISFIRSEDFNPVAAETARFMGNKEMLKDELLRIAGTATIPRSAIGPYRMGKASALFSDLWAAQSAAVYHAAFSNSETAFPYWEVER